MQHARAPVAANGLPPAGPTARRSGWTILSIAFLVLAPAPAAAQPELRSLDELTAGLHLPVAPLAGDADAFSVVTNPAGLRFLRGLHLGLHGVAAGMDQPGARGGGLGLYLGRSLGGGLLPDMGLGLALELPLVLGDDLGAGLDVPRPARLTLGYGASIAGLGVGVSWHHMFAEAGHPASGMDTFDVGVSRRMGARWAWGGAVRDLGVLHGTPVERRYELEVVSRPTGTDRLELGAGARVGEGQGRGDAWLRWSVGVARGVHLRGALETRALVSADAALPGARDYRLSAGVEISFGTVGAAVYGTGARVAGGEVRGTGAAVSVRYSEEHAPSVLGRPQRLERVALTSELDERALASTLLALRRMARDEAVAAVFVQIEGPVDGWAAAEELRGALAALRQAGKRVYVYLVSASTRDYLIASAADRIYVDPAGGLRLIGLSSTTLYFKGAFDKLGVSAEFVRIGAYKSAPEAYTRSEASEPALHMRQEIYDGIYEVLVARIAEARDLDRAAVERLIDRGPYTAGDLGEGEARALVDAVVLPDQVGEHVRADLGRAVAVAVAPRERPDTWWRPAVAVVSIEGDIVDGPSRSIPLLGRRMAGGETISKAIAQARSDPRVRAVVLRIDSPGGSALASEVMAREVFATRGVKPIICSLGDVAASGGYYAAAGCEVIFAEASTITGSIGIFTGKFDVSGLLSRLGVSWQSYQRGAHANLESMFEPYSEDERALVEDKLRYFYERFLDTVAKGRGMTRDQVDEIGRGRVWTGARAQEVGLVDRLGGLVDALALARERAGLGEGEQVDLVWLPEPHKGLMGLLRTLTGSAAERDASLDWPPGVRALRDVLPASLWAQPDAVQARLPFAIFWD